MFQSVPGTLVPQLCWSPIYPPTHPLGYIPDLGFAVIISRRSGSQAQREILLLITLQIHRHIMENLSSKIKIIWKQRSFTGIFFITNRSQMWRHFGKQNVGGPVWLESWETGQGGQSVFHGGWSLLCYKVPWTLLLLLLLSCPISWAAFEAAEHALEKPSFLKVSLKSFWLCDTSFLHLCVSLQSSQGPFKVYILWDFIPASSCLTLHTLGGLDCPCTETPGLTN